MSPAWRKVDIPKRTDQRGSLCYLEEGADPLPFPIRRVYYLFDVSSDRGGHAHREDEQLLIAVAGKFWVTCLNQDENSESFYLDDPATGLYVPPMTWVNLFDFSVGGICLVLASGPYDEDDYIRNMVEFLEARRPRNRMPI